MQLSAVLVRRFHLLFITHKNATEAKVPFVLIFIQNQIRIKPATEARGRVMKPKPGKYDKRPLGVASTRYPIIQKALSVILEAILEK